MREAEPRCVQKLARESELLRTPVQRVARNGEIDRREMHTDLMRTAGFELDIQQRVSRQELHQLEVRHRLARRVRVERVTERIAPVAPDRRLDPPAARPRS